MSEWRKRLQPASFRGVPFQFETDSAPVGRDTQLHEYPKRDKPYVEDMGRKTRIFRLQAFVVGSTCLEQRDALLAALDEPGPGELVHPWYGRMTVTATGDCTVSHDRREGGVVRFDLVFVESGELGFPAARPNQAKQVQTSAQRVGESAASRFDEAMNGINMSRVKVNAIGASVSSLYAAINSDLRPLTGLFSSSGALLDNIMNAPRNLPSLIFDTLGGLDRSFPGFSDSGTSINNSARAARTFAEAPKPPGADAGKLHGALVGLLQDAAIHNALLDAAQVPVVAVPPPSSSVPDLDAQLAQPDDPVDVPVAADIIATRDVLTGAIYDVALAAGGSHYPVMTDARQAAHVHLSNAARAGLRLVSFQPATTMPALVLAYRLYADAGRAGEIASRNRIRHPGFVPAVPLQVARKQ